MVLPTVDGRLIRRLPPPPLGRLQGGELTDRPLRHAVRHEARSYVVGGASGLPSGGGASALPVPMLVGTLITKLDARTKLTLLPSGGDAVSPVLTMKVSSAPRSRKTLKLSLVVTVVGRLGVFVGGVFRRCGTTPHAHLRTKPPSMASLRISRRKATLIAG